jgi:hypothetical protein
VMTHRAKRGDENVNVLRTPARLGESKHRHEQERRADVKDQVAPAAQDPEIAFRRTRRDGRDSLGTGERGDVLH